MKNEQSKDLLGKKKKKLDLETFLKETESKPKKRKMKIMIMMKKNLHQKIKISKNQKINPKGIILN